MKSQQVFLLSLASAATLLAGCSAPTEPAASPPSAIFAAPFSSGRQSTTTSASVALGDAAAAVPPGGVSTQGFGYGATNDPETMFVDAPIVVAGVIGEVGAARWNSADGKRWPNDLGTDADAPMLYRLVQLAVTDVLKGEAQVGTTIGLIVWGERMTEYATAEEDGDPIKPGLRAIAAIEPVFGGAWGLHAVWPADAYFAFNGAQGVLIDTPEGFLNAVAVGVPEENREPGVRGITLDEARGIAGRDIIDFEQGWPAQHFYTTGPFVIKASKEDLAAVSALLRRSLELEYEAMLTANRGARVEAIREEYTRIYSDAARALTKHLRAIDLNAELLEQDGYVQQELKLTRFEVKALDVDGEQATAVVEEESLGIRARVRDQPTPDTLTIRSGRQIKFYLVRQGGTWVIFGESWAFLPGMGP